MLDAMLQFGVAGLMGVLWVWERGHSRRREQQLSAAHDKLMQRDDQLHVMTRIVHRNTRALVESERTQRRLGDILEAIRHEISHNHGSE